MGRKWLKQLHRKLSTRAFSTGLRLFLFALMITILTVLLINIQDFSHEFDTKGTDRKLVSIGGAWQVSEIGDDQYQLTMRLPETMPDFTKLAFETDHQTIVASVNGDELYRRTPSNPWYLGHEVGRVWNVIGLPSEYAGETLTLVIGNYAGMRLFTHTSFMGSYRQINRFLLYDVLPAIIIIAFAIVLSVVFLITAFAMKQRGMKHVSNGAFYLAVAFCLISLQLAMDSFVVQLLDINMAFAYIIAQTMFIVLPVILMQYLRSQVSRFNLVLDLLSLIQIVFLGSALYFHFHGMRYLVQFQPGIRALLIIYISISTLICLHELIKGDPARDNRIAIASILFVAVSGLFIVVSWSLGNRDMNIAAYILMIELVFILMQGVEYLRKIISAFIGAAESRGLKKLAYEDAMTGLLNRTAFDKDLANVNHEIYQYHSVGALVLDLNNLKQTNDDLGHYEGDFLIVAAANLIKNTFGQIGKAYRYGGDEFIVFLLDDQIPKMPEMMSIFNKNIEEYNAKHDVPISISWGFSSITVTEDVPGDTLLKRLITKADERMYSYKRQQATHR